MRGSILFVVTFMIAIQGLVSWLVYRLLKKLVPVFRHRTLRYGYWGVTFLTGAITSSSRWFYSIGVPTEVISAAFVWLIALLVMLPLLLLIAIIAHFVAVKETKKASAEAATDRLGRRDFLRNSLAVVPVAAFGVSSAGIYRAGDISLQHHKLTLPNFPATLPNFKLIQISDTHLGSFFSIEKLDQVLGLIAKEKPDMVAITGDLIDDLALLEPTMERLTRFQASLPYGMHFCWGNHEYFRDIATIRRALANSPITVLENNSRLIIGGAQPFYLLGVDYPWAKDGITQIEIRRRYFESTLRSVPGNAFSILLSHHPDFIENAFAAGIPLTLTGHTHGGQIGILGRPVLPLQYQFMRGLYRKNNLYGYVSTGTGHWLPFRFGCPAEISIFTLSG